MTRSDINFLIRSARDCFQAHEWHLPPAPRWDVTDFGLGEWQSHGLVLVNLAEEPEYCEKLMYARKNMSTPAHCHAKKKEDIICRYGRLAVRVWAGVPDQSEGRTFALPVNHAPYEAKSGEVIELPPGHRVTLVPGIYHEFHPVTDECIISEVSTANDDLHDNFFVDERIGRYPGVEEDETPLLRLVSDK